MVRASVASFRRGARRSLPAACRCCSPCHHGRHLRADRDADDDRIGRPDEGDRAMSEEFIGSGWAFPLRTDPTGRIALVSREQEIEESIRLILGTAIGERPMRPEFGCAIHDYIFDTEDSSILYIDIRYAVGETNDPRNLVFPFYVIPPETS